MSSRSHVERTPGGALPPWSSVLAVVAHPDDESFGLGAVLDAFSRAGTAAAVLCLTKAEASTIHGVSGDLASPRAAELQSAAAALGVEKTLLNDHPDGALDRVGSAVLALEVEAVAVRQGGDGLLVFDPLGVTGHPDHVAASQAAVEAAAHLSLPVLGWILPQAVAKQLNEELGAGFVGHLDNDIDLVLAVDLDRQRTASLAHASQAIPTSVLWRRLELLGDQEHLRCLRLDPETSRQVSLGDALRAATGPTVRATAHRSDNNEGPHEYTARKRVRGPTPARATHSRPSQQAELVACGRARCQ